MGCDNCLLYHQFHLHFGIWEEDANVPWWVDIPQMDVRDRMVALEVVDVQAGIIAVVGIEALKKPHIQENCSGQFWPLWNGIVWLKVKHDLWRRMNRRVHIRSMENRTMAENGA